MRSLLVLLVTVVACASPPHPSPASVAGLRESPEDALDVCRYLGRFSGNSTLPGKDGLDQAREEARLRAAEAGATNFFYASESPSPDATKVTVKGYDCAQPPDRRR